MAREKSSRVILGDRGLRRDAASIFSASLKAADPVEAVLRHVRVRNDVLEAGDARYRLRSVKRVFVIGAGKAGAPMAKALEKMLGTRIAGGLVNVKYGHTARLRRVD